MHADALLDARNAAEQRKNAHKQKLKSSLNDKLNKELQTVWKNA